MASLDLRLLIVVFYASTIPVLGQDGGGSCAVAEPGSLMECLDKVHVVLEVSVLNETVSAIPVQATKQAPPTPPKKPPPWQPTYRLPFTRSKFTVEQTHFKAQMEVMRKLRRQFSTVPPHYERDIEYYDHALDQFDEYVNFAEAHSGYNYCAQDGRLSTYWKHLVPIESAGSANDYEVFPGVGVYRFHTKPLRWEDARRQCEAEDAHLVVVNSQEEANVTTEMFSRCPHLKDQQLNDYAYVGVRQVKVNGHYETVQGENLDASGYCKWDFGHPDSSPTRNVKCVSITRQGDLVDLDCHLRLAYFCEYEGI